METWKDLISAVEQRHGIVSYAQLIDAGMSHRQITRERDAGRLVPVHRGVYRVGGAPPTFEARVAAALDEVGADSLAWASHHTAGEMWGLGVHSRERRIEVTRPTPLSARRSGVRVHRSTLIPPHHVTTLRGLQIMTASRTIFDLARTTADLRLTQAVRQAIHTDGIPCSIPSLYRVLYDLGGQGRPGTRRMRRVLDGWDEQAVFTESDLDEVGRALLGGIPGIRWQVEMSDEEGYIRRVDGLVDHASLVIELDSRFHDDPLQRALDDDGDRRLRRLGYTTKRYRSGDLTRRGDLTLAEVEQLVVLAGARAAAA